MPSESVFFINTDENKSAPSISILEKYCKDWNKYLMSFEAALGAKYLPYDNEMSAIGSLLSAISRYNKDFFVVHEAIVRKNGNSASNNGRADMWVASGEDGRSELYFEAKRHRKIIDTRKGLEDAFSKPETSMSVRSLIGRGIRDRTKTTGSIYRIRKTGQDVMLLLAHLKLSEEFKESDVTDQLSRVFNGTVTVRTKNGLDETSKKNMKYFPTIGFLFVSKMESPNSPNALLSTMTLL